MDQTKERHRGGAEKQDNYNTDTKIYIAKLLAATGIETYINTKLAPYSR